LCINNSKTFLGARGGAVGWGTVP